MVNNSIIFIIIDNIITIIITIIIIIKNTIIIRYTLMYTYVTLRVVHITVY